MVIVSQEKITQTTLLLKVTKKKITYSSLAYRINHLNQLELFE